MVLIKDNNFVVLEHVDHMKDLGVVIDNELTFDQHISDKVNKAFQMLGIINRNFSDLDEQTFLVLEILKFVMPPCPFSDQSIVLYLP